MAHKKITDVRQYATGTGAGALTLAATAISANYRTMQAAGMADTDTAYVEIRHATIPSQWEIVLVTYAASGTAITPSFDSKSKSATGALISFSAGNKIVREARHDGVDWIIDRETGPANVADFGAVADGATDSLAAFDAAIVAGNGAIVIPPGDYRLSGALELDYYHTSIVGDGRGITKLIFESGGLVVTTTFPADPTSRINSSHTLRGLTIQTVSTGLIDTAVTYRSFPVRAEAFVTISDIEIVGGDGLHGNFMAFTGTSHTSTTIDGIADTSSIAVNDMIFGSGIPANAYVVSKTATSITLDRASSSSVTETFFNWRGPLMSWLSGIKLDTIWHVNMTNVNIEMLGAVGATDSKAIEITCDDDVALFDYEWTGINTRGATTAVYVKGWVEGLLASNCNFYVCRDALVMLHATDPMVGTICFTNCAFTSSRIPVQSNRLKTLQFANCQFYKVPNEYPFNPVDSGRLESDGIFWYPGSLLKVTGESDPVFDVGLQVSNCVFYSGVPGTGLPMISLVDVRAFNLVNINVAFGTYSSLFDFSGTTSGSWDAFDVRWATITGDITTNTSSEFVFAGRMTFDGEAATLFADARQAFAADDATPSVMWLHNKSAFYTANVNPTTITQFDDAAVGQRWTVVINDDNTTLAHSAALLLDGGINCSPPNGAVLTFLQEGTTYAREVGRLLPTATALFTDARVAFSANDATPSVFAVQGKSAFYTQNTNPTTITQFDNATVGQRWTVVINDDNTTLAHSAALLLRGGQDYTPANGTIVHFLQEGGGYARETARLDAKVTGNTAEIFGGISVLATSTTAYSYITIDGGTSAGGIGALEITGKDIAFIDLKCDVGDDYDLRALSNGSLVSLQTRSGVPLLFAAEGSGNNVSVYTDGALRFTFHDDGATLAGSLTGSEISTPAAPAANGWVIYGEDNGAGKTRLMVRFASGAAQQIAIEP